MPLSVLWSCSLVFSLRLTDRVRHTCEHSHRTKRSVARLLAHSWSQRHARLIRLKVCLLNRNESYSQHKNTGNCILDLILTPHDRSRFLFYPIVAFLEYSIACTLCNCSTKRNVEVPQASIGMYPIRDITFYYWNCTPHAIGLNWAHVQHDLNEHVKFSLSSLTVLPQAKYEERLLVFCSKGSGQVSEMLSLLEKSGVETNIYDKVGQ